MILCDHQLFFIGVGTKLNDLHAVEQGSGDGIEGVGRGDKHHTGKIKGNFQIIIAIGCVLLAVEHLKKSCTGITTIIGAHLINLIQKQ